MLITIDNGRKTTIEVTGVGVLVFLEDDADEPLKIETLGMWYPPIAQPELLLDDTLRLASVSLVSSPRESFYQVTGARVSFLVSCEGKLRVTKRGGREAA